MPVEKDHGESKSVLIKREVLDCIDTSSSHGMLKEHQIWLVFNDTYFDNKKVCLIFFEQLTDPFVFFGLYAFLSQPAIVYML